MKFVDEATIKVQAGNGGRGMVSFRREKFIPFGGPDGGDGGTGGSVFLVARQGLNTLADFRYQRTFKGDNGQPGGSADCSGRGGDDLEIVVPIGTVVYDTETDETLGDLTHDGERILVDVFPSDHLHVHFGAHYRCKSMLTLQEPAGLAEYDAVWADLPAARAHDRRGVKPRTKQVLSRAHPQ
jgi:hypothetical protein